MFKILKETGEIKTYTDWNTFRLLIPSDIASTKYHYTNTGIKRPELNVENIYQSLPSISLFVKEKIENFLQQLFSSSHVLLDINEVKAESIVCKSFGFNVLPNTSIDDYVTKFIELKHFISVHSISFYYIETNAYYLYINYLLNTNDEKQALSERVKRIETITTVLNEINNE